MKLIDILNKIANGELKEGTRVKYKDIELIYEDGELQDEEGYTAFYIVSDMSDVLEECELIEPECKHEWEVETVRNGLGDIVQIFRRCVKCNKWEEAKQNVEADKMAEDTQIEELEVEIENVYNVSDVITAILETVTKVNEIIRKVNSQEKEIKEIKEELDC